MTPSDTLTLGNSKRALSALCYGLRRLIDFESAWIAYFPEYREKISIGLAIGYTAQAFEAASCRIREQDPIEPDFISRSPSLVHLFDAMSNEHDLLRIQAFIVSATNVILMGVHQIQKGIDPLYDQPSLWAVREMAQSLEEKLAMLEERGWPAPEKLPDLTATDGPGVKWNPNTSKPVLLNDPLRPAVLRQSNENTLQGSISQLLDTIEGRRRFVHFIYADIEVAAAEICARNIVEYGADMPSQFMYDMARQCTDEARHAIMAEQILISYGGKLGDYTYKNNIWAAYMKGDNLAEKLAIEQVIGEGNGLDMTELFMDQFKEKGLDSLLRYYEFLQADEVIHCAFGNRWIKYLVKENEEAFTAVVNSALRKTDGQVPGFAPVCVPLRRAAEYSDNFINEKLLKNIPR